MANEVDMYDEIQEVSIDDIKKLLIKINDAKLKVNAPISFEHPLLIKQIERCAYQLYCDLIYNGVDFSIKGFNKKSKTDVEDDCSLEFFSFISEDRTIIYDLIAYRFANKSKYQHGTYSHLFHCPIFSKYTNQNEDVFFIKSKKKFIILDTEKCLKEEYSIVDFCIDYLGVNYENATYIENELDKIYQDVKGSHEEIQELFYNFSINLNEKLVHDFSMSKGVITFCDFLGWKGLWRENTGSVNYLADASALITNIEDKMHKIIQEKIPYSKDYNISRLISISDTIAILTPKVSFLDEKDMVEMHAAISKFILEESTQRCFAIRGAITYGEYSYKGNIMLGPGIDECASWHEKADWIGVALSPSSEIVIEDAKTLKYIEKYKVPMKDKSPGLNYCVNWNISKMSYMTLISRTKALTPEIAGKYVNTRNFLKGAWNDEK